MGTLRNSFVAIAAVAVLLGSLLILLPKGADAVEVTLSPAGVGSLTTTGFDVTATVNIPANEFIPVNYVKVLATAANGAFSSGLLQAPYICEPDTNSGVTVTSISGGGAASVGLLNGYGYDPVPDSYGYGYVIGPGATVDFSAYDGGYVATHGYGYGYGYGGASAVELRVTVRVTGCTFTGLFDASGLGTFRVQLLVGSDATRVFKSTPAAVTFFDPAVTPAAGAPVTPAVQTDHTESSTGAGFRFTLYDPTGTQRVFGTGISLPLTGVADGIAAGGTVTLDIIPAAGLPPGTTLNLDFVDQSAIASPPFSIDATALASQTASGVTTAAGYFQVTYNGGPVPANTIRLTFALKVPLTYFGVQPVSGLRLVEFSDAGVLQRVLGPTLIADQAGPQVTFTFVIDTFSSFALVSSPIASGGGGGGGGGGATTTTAATTTVPGGGSTTQPGTTTAPSTTAPGTTTGGTTTLPGTTTKPKGGIPGFEAIALVTALGAAVLLVRRRLA